MRIPVLPTIVVAAAVATMIGLGIWQLQRAEWKEALIAEMEATTVERRDVVTCAIDADPEIRAGRSAAGMSGYRYLVPCNELTLDIGWSQRPNALTHVARSGTFAGVRTVSRAGARPILVLDTPFAPLETSAPPSVADLPNNHMLYAVQWFFFALAAAVIYVLALRRRRRR